MIKSKEVNFPDDFRLREVLSDQVKDFITKCLDKNP